MRTTTAAVSLAPILLLACSSVSGAGSVQGPSANAAGDHDVFRGSRLRRRARHEPGVDPGARDRVPRVEEERAEIESVTAADVHRLARTILARRSTRWVVSGDRSAAARAAQANALGQLHRMLAGR